MKQRPRTKSNLKYNLVIIGCVLGVITSTIYMFETVPPGTISDTGEVMQVNGYTISTVPEEDWNNEDAIGYTHRNVDGDIFIKGDLPATSKENTCVHEQLHNLIPNYIDKEKEHDIIYSIDDELETETCRVYIQRLERDQGGSFGLNFVQTVYKVAYAVTGKY